MALSKAATTTFNVAPVSLYWKITAVHADTKLMTVSVHLDAYPDKASSDAKAAPMAGTDFAIVATTIADMEGLTWLKLYTAAKALPMFSGALDV